MVSKTNVLLCRIELDNDIAMLLEILLSKAASSEVMKSDFQDQCIPKEYCSN